MKITLKSIPHNEQAYETCGDYIEDVDGITILVSEMPDERHMWLVAVHELIEVLLMKDNGIPLQASTDFDIPFEAARENSQQIVSTNTDDGHLEFAFQGRWYPMSAEPGDSRDAPYQREHCLATAVERMLCAAMDVRWAEYEEAVSKL
jgi:hypothetical protein